MARAQSTLAVVSEPAAETASAEAPVESAPLDVRVVDNRADAEDVVRRLMALEDDGCPLYHAVDTEVLSAASRLLRRVLALKHMTRSCALQVSDIDVTKETPVGHGKVTCFSVYCGPQMDFGGGKARLWVDVLKGGREVLHAFKPYLESETILKVRGRSALGLRAVRPPCG